MSQMGLNSSGSGPPGGAVVVIIVVVACFWFGWQPVLLFGLSIVKFIFAAAVTIASSAAVGAWNGFGTATAALRAISETLNAASLGALNYPGVGPAVIGVLAGATIAWLQTARRLRHEYQPLISAVFSAEPLRSGGFEFLWLLVADAMAGYLVMIAFAAVNMVGTSEFAGPNLSASVSLVIGFGGSGGFGGADDLFASFVFLLAALILAGALIGAVAGGGVGVPYGLGLWMFDSREIIFGATEGATIRWLTRKRNAKDASSIEWHVLAGAWNGALEGAIVGALAGAIASGASLFK